MDVAVFFINTTDVIPVPKMGSSDLLKLGDSILAIGTPSYGTQLINSLVKGTISGLARRQFISFTDQSVSLTPISVADYPAFQFDAPINGGMEGGPVINSAGEIVGMISYKFLNLNSSVNNESISLAAAIDDLKLPINQIIEKGSYTRPTMGISVTDVNQMTLAQREQNAIEPNTFTGTFVAQVSTNSAASRAGMRANEVVIEIDGVSIFGITTVSSILHRKLFGDVINVKTINTNGVINEYRLTL
jgi:serine protease Do